MRRFAIAAPLLFLLSAAPVIAQAPAPAAPAAGQAPAPPAQPPAPAPQPPAPFPQGAKVGFVDFQRVAQESVEGQGSTARINALVAKKQAEGAEKAKQLTLNQQKLQQSGGVMSDQARTQLEKEIERQQREGERFQQDAQAEIQELQQELQLEFQKRLIPLLQQVAQEKGLQLLLSRADADHGAGGCARKARAGPAEARCADYSREAWVDGARSEAVGSLARQRRTKNVERTR
jgi:outer membrane protein